MKNKRFNRRQIILVCLLVGIILLGLLGGIGIRNHFYGALQVNAFPNDSSVTIDNLKMPLGKEIGVSTGVHTLKVSRAGFATQTKQITVKSRDRQLIQFYLLSNSASGDDWLNLHPDQALQIDGSGSRLYEKNSAQNTANNPLVSILPLYDPQFRIDYGGSLEHPNDDNAVGIYITAMTPDARQSALQLIRDKGYDPSDMEINFQTP